MIYLVFRVVGKDCEWDVYESTFAKESDADWYIADMSQLNPKYKYRCIVANVK